jgi:hypothetical protein
MYNKIQILQIKIAPEGPIFILFLIFELQTLTHTLSMRGCVKRIDNDPECIMYDTLTEEAVLNVLGRGNGLGDVGCLVVQPPVIHAVH